MAASSVRLGAGRTPITTLLVSVLPWYPELSNPGLRSVRAGDPNRPISFRNGPSDAAQPEREPPARVHPRLVVGPEGPYPKHRARSHFRWDPAPPFFPVQSSKKSHRSDRYLSSPGDTAPPHPHPHLHI